MGAVATGIGAAGTGATVFFWRKQPVEENASSKHKDMRR
jgi:hypothetical protein